MYFYAPSGHATFTGSSFSWASTGQALAKDGTDFKLRNAYGDFIWHSKEYPTVVKSEFGVRYENLLPPDSPDDAVNRQFVEDMFKGFDYDAQYVYIDKYYFGTNGYDGSLHAPYTNFSQALATSGRGRT